MAAQLQRRQRRKVTPELLFFLGLAKHCSTVVENNALSDHGGGNLLEITDGKIVGMKDSMRKRVWADIKYYQIPRYLQSFAINALNIEYRTAVTASLGFYSEKKMHTQLPWWGRQRVLLFEEVERLSQVIWCDVGMQRFIIQTWRTEFQRTPPAHWTSNILALKQEEMAS